MLQNRGPERDPEIKNWIQESNGSKPRRGDLWIDEAPRKNYFFSGAAWGAEKLVGQNRAAEKDNREGWGSNYPQATPTGLSVLHLLQRFDSQHRQTLAKHSRGQIAKGQPAFAQARRCFQNRALLEEPIIMAR